MNRARGWDTQRRPGERKKREGCQKEIIGGGQGALGGRLVSRALDLGLQVEVIYKAFMSYHGYWEAASKDCRGA